MRHGEVKTARREPHALGRESGAAPSAQTVTFDFSGGAQGWQAGSADHPAGREDFYELESDYRALPAPLGPARSALFVSGNNHSDDLFMFFRRRITGL